MHHPFRKLFIACFFAVVFSCPVNAAESADDDEAALQPGRIGLVIETLAPHGAGVNDADLRGVRIKEVTPGGPADKLGLRVGDVIIRANDKTITAHSEVAALLQDRLVGATTRLRVVRGADRSVADIVVPAAVQPVLRIDAGMHNAPIRRLAVDAKARWLITAAEDKTAKVWDLTTGRLAVSLRPPVGDGNEGRLQAVAVAPDGGMIAIGGTTGTWDKMAAVYLFDRASGRMLRQLDSLPAKIEGLAWSPDGSLLAVSVAGKGGVFVYRTADWTAVGRDENYTAAVTAVDFDLHNRLLSTSQDGFLRIYTLAAEGMQLRARQMAPGGRQPAAARFSPDGTRVAVGYFDSTQVSVFDGNQLDFLFAPNTAGVRNGDLRAVAWSGDGRTLIAAGRFVTKGHQAVRSWSNAGQGEAKDEPLADNSIFDVLALPGGGWVYCTAEPACGIHAADGKRRFSMPSPIVDFRGAGQQLQVSRDGHAVRFAFERNGAQNAYFDAEEGLAAAETKGGKAAFPPIVETSGLAVSGWKNEAKPKLNGQPVRLRPGENARSLAIAPDGARFVLGSDWGLNTYDRTGRLVWRIPAPGAAWAVNFSSDGRYLVAAFADGTIRWYGAANGQEKLALFVHTDRRRWVAWTPSGYYATSPAGEGLIGWHINNGKDRAGDFYPASRFRAKFFRPDVVAKVLETKSEAEALKLANQESGRNVPHIDIAQALPPAVDAVSPGEASFADTQVRLRYKVRTLAAAPLLGIRVRVNGAYVPDVQNPAAGQNGGEAEHSLSLVLPERDTTVEVFAENRHGVSTPATFKFAWKGAPTRQQHLPTLHLVAIGVSAYRDNSMNLAYPAKDARDFAETIKQQQGRLYGEIQVHILTDAQATQQAVLDVLADLKRNVKKDDVGVLFLAGHGFNSKDGTYYYVPFDFNRKQRDTSGVIYSAIRNTLAEMPGQAMLFIDTCHSGNVLGRTDLTGVINDLTAHENNVIVFASSTQKEQSQESEDWKNGAFTKALIEGLRGGGDVFKEGKVMYSGLYTYLSRRVTTLTDGAQHPVILPGGIEDFVVAIP